MEFDEAHLRTLSSVHTTSCMTLSIKGKTREAQFLDTSSSLLKLSIDRSMNMIKEFLQPNRKQVFVEDREKVSKKLHMRGVMDQPELSLGPSISAFAETVNSSSSDSDANLGRKRKHAWDESSMGTQTSIELQLSDPLPRDWEQCLDLQSGRMYYLNRKTLKKNWFRPREQKIDLELNISTPATSEEKADTAYSTITTTASHEQQHPNKYANSSGSMVAVACLHCHLLVMLSKASPSCPNCKYMHSLPLLLPQPRKVEPVKPLETLSLLH